MIFSEVTENYINIISNVWMLNGVIFMHDRQTVVKVSVLYHNCQLSTGMEFKDKMLFHACDISPEPLVLTSHSDGHHSKS